jgi:hypothetical protein
MAIGKVLSLNCRLSQTEKSRKRRYRGLTKVSCSPTHFFVLGPEKRAYGSRATGITTRSSEGTRETISSACSSHGHEESDENYHA